MADNRTRAADGIERGRKKPLKVKDRYLYGLAGMQPGMTVFDPYLGSGSSRIAAWDAGLDFVGCEISKVYFDLQEERFRKHTEQLNLFLMGGDE